MKRIFFFLLACCLCYINAFATHIVGGDITYKRLSGNNYEIKLDVIRDCSSTGNAPFDSQTDVYILDGSSFQPLNTLPSSSANTSISYPSLNAFSCFATVLCYERQITTYTTSLPPNSNGYWITYGRCCRNGTITNIDNPLGVGLTLATFVPNVTVINSSPVVGLAIPSFVCAGDSISFDFSATDADGDSLVYEFAQVVVGGSQSNPIPYAPQPNAAPVDWLPGYDFQHPLSANSYTYLNPQTGLLSVYSTQIGQYVFAIAFSEYRNGVLIGKTRREMQMNVINCLPVDIAPTFEFAQGYNVFSNDTLYLHAGSQNQVPFTMTDLMGNGQHEPFIYGNITGEIFDINLFGGPALPFNPVAGMSPLYDAFYMTPLNSDIGKVGKCYVTISSPSTCPVHYSLLDSFYVKILPCESNDSPPTYYLDPGLNTVLNDTVYFHAENNNQIFLSMIDWNMYLQPEPLIYGTITGEIFDSNLFDSTAVPVDTLSGPSWTWTVIEMMPSLSDVGKIGKVYIHIWNPYTCPNSSNLHDSFYIKILPCQNLTDAPMITEVEILNSTSVQLKWVSSVIFSDFDHYVLERRTPSTAWQQIATFPDNSYWNYIDNNALYTDGTPFCYRMGVVTSCGELLFTHYSADSCTYSLPDTTTSASSKQASIHFSPNPSKTGLVRIDMKDFMQELVSVRIADRFGKIVWEKELLLQESGSLTLNMKDLGFNNDLYYVSVMSSTNRNKKASAVLVIQQE